MSDPEELLLKATGKLVEIKNAQDKYFELTGVSSSTLEPADILGGRAKKERGFIAEYYPRAVIDNEIWKRIEANDNLLIIGAPISGKTRALYEALKNLSKTRNILLPKFVDIDPNDLSVPIPVTFFKDRILVIDDIDKYVSKENFVYLLNDIHRRNLKKGNFIIAATCRTGPELEIVNNKPGLRLFDIFGEPIIIPTIDDSEGERIADKYKLKFSDKFDGNIGSLFMSLEEMEKRFSNLGEIEKGILCAIKRLYRAGIYTGKDLFSIDHIKRVCEEVEGITLERYRWRPLLKSIEDAGFIDQKGNWVYGEEAYLEYIIDEDLHILDNLVSMISVFANDIRILYLIGSKVIEIGEIVREKALYMKTAIEAYQSALKTLTKREDRYSHAMTRNSLGLAYWRLSEVENPRENIEESIKNFMEALKVRTLKEFPTNYAMTQNNLGVSYQRLSQLDDPARNLMLSVTAYREALKVYTIEEFPIQYATIQNNLGVSHGTLAQIENPLENRKLEIAAYREALRVQTFEKFPIHYSTVQNNLGISYRGLSELDDLEGNLKRAVDAYHEALRVRTFENFPIQYANTQNNLGVSYWGLSQLDDPAVNLKRAIDAYHEALKVNTPENLPINYALTMENLGLAYANLAEVEEREKNYARAEEAVEAALAIFRRQKMTRNIEKAERNLERIKEFRNSPPPKKNR